MTSKRQKLALSIFIIFIIVAISLFFFWPRPSQHVFRYNIDVDDVVYGYAREPVILHATTESDTGWWNPGWDTNNDSVIDLEAVWIDTTSPVIASPWDYKEYKPWNSNATENERRWYAYTQFNQSGNYSLMFLLRGVDGWHKKEVNVSIIEPMINLTVTPIESPFHSGEDIIFRAQVKNEGPYPIRIREPSIFPGTITVQIIIPNGTIIGEYSPSSSIVIRPGSGLISLEPEQTYVVDDKTSFNLTYENLYFGNLSKGIEQYKFNDTGNYKVVMEYFFGRPYFGNPDRGIYETEFQVIK